MIEGLRPYPEMKDSGVPWLGEVPAHWQVRPLKSMLVARVNGSWGDDPDVSGVVAKCIRATDFDHVRLMAKVSAAPKRSYAAADFERRRLSRGDLVMATSGGTQDVAVGAVVVFDSDEKAAPTNFAMKLVTHASVVPRFLAYLMSAANRNGVTRALTDQVTIANLDTGRFLASQALLPPIVEQALIVRFLDDADRRIQRYIRAKQKLIKLLEEQKQAIIHRAVTRGLEPNVGLKPSGVEWLGDVPEHWGVVRLGSLLRERGETNEHGEMTYVLSLLRDRGVIPYDEKGNIGNKKSEDITRYKVVRPGDIVVNCMNVIIGSVGLSRYTGCLSPVYYVLVRRSARDDPNYLDAVFQCRRFHQSLIRIGNGILAHRMRIPMELLKCELLPHPPAEEQMQIVRAIREWTRSCDDAIARASQEISLFREYRNRLIADVVTGKLDVREAAARLPDESDEPDVVDEVGEGLDAVEVSEGELDDVLEGVEA